MTDLEFIQSLTEEEFCEWVLIPLLDAMEYKDIRYTHGYLERGKDIVFIGEDHLQGSQHFCATVKRFALKGSVTGSRSIREVVFQIRQALSSPFVDPSNGTNVSIERVFVVTPFPISQPAIQSISDDLRQYENRVTFIDGAKLMTLIKQHLPSLVQSLPNPESRYIYLLCQRFLDNPTLSRLGSSRPLTLLDIYTGGKLSPTTKDDAKYISFALPTDKSQLGPSSSLSEVLSAHPYCVVLADVGSGKTTLLQKLALDIGGFGELPHKRKFSLLPVFFSLASIPPDWLLSFERFCNFMTEHLASSDKYDGFSVESAEHCILLLDGFDELQGSHNRVLKYVVQLTEKFPHIVLTSRPSRTPDLPAPFGYFRLVPFTDEDIREFLAKWFPDNADIQSAVVARIGEHPSLLQFCRTPLILTLYSLLAGSIDTLERLPVRRTAIYGQIVEMLLGKWDQLRSVRNQFDPDVKQHVLELVALATHSQGGRSFTARMLNDTTLEVLGDDEPERAQSLINELVFRSSLIRRKTNDDFEFVHLSFQEFLAAKRLSRNVGERSISHHVLDEWWKGTLIFYCGICRAMDGLQLPRRRKKERGLGLLFMEFMSEADYTGPKKRNEIVAALVDDLLGSGELSQSDLQICHRVGDSLVGLLDRVVARKGFQGNLGNYFRILRNVGTRKALSVHWERTEFFDRLSLTALLDTLQGAIPLCRDEASVRFLTKGFVLLGHRIESTEWEYVPTLVRCAIGMNDTSVELVRISKKKLLEQKLLAQLLDSWRRTSVAFISSIRDGDWVGQMQLDDARTILEALAQIGTDRDIGNAAALCFSRIAAIRRVSIRVASVEEHDSILAELENTSDSLEFADRERSHAILRDRLNSNRLWTWT